MEALALLVGPGVVAALIVLLIRVRRRRLTRLLREARDRDPYLSVTERSAESLGLEPADLTETASAWRFPPLAGGERVRADLMLGTHAGQWRDRQVIAGTGYQMLSAGGAENLCYLQVTAARINAPAEAVSWLAAAPAGADRQAPIRDAGTGAEIPMWGTLPGQVDGMFSTVAGYQVPAPVRPQEWQVRAHNTRLAAMLMERAPGLLADPGSIWRIDDLDLVHIKPVPYGARPLDAETLRDRLDLVCRAAKVTEELLRAGWGDRPYTPGWPPGSPVGERFPDDVLKALAAAGWHQGRRDGAGLAETVKGAQGFPAVAEALAEFGGLRIAHDATGSGTPAGTFSVTPWAREEISEEISEALAFVEQHSGKRVFPLGALDNDVHDGPLVLAIDENGRVFGLRYDDDLLLGQTMDEAIIKLVRGIFTPRVGSGGSLRTCRSKPSTKPLI